VKTVMMVLKEHDRRILRLFHRINSIENRLDGLRVEQDGRLKRLVE